MKPIKDKIRESQDFYNGVALGIFLGTTGVLLFIVNNLGPVTVRLERS